MDTFSGRGKYFSVFSSVQMAFLSTQPFRPKSMAALFLGIKRLGFESNHSPPQIGEIEEVWSHTSTSQLVARYSVTYWHKRAFWFSCKLVHK